MFRHRALAGLQLFALTFLAFYSGWVAASDTPHAFVKKTADELVAALTADPESLKSTPGAYEKIVNKYLVPAVDFETLSKFVMGKKFYLGATPEQRIGFQKVFKDSLVETYATGLSIFDSQQITVLPAAPGNEGKKMQAVKMEVRTAEGTIFPLSFTMKKMADGSWKVVNVVLNGVNVAKAYNSHFSETMTKHGGSMDELIANWSSKIDTFDENAPAQ
jgi:phospholipid transport system substrate-binding protein